MSDADDQDIDPNLQAAIDDLDGLRGVPLLDGMCRVIDVADAIGNGEAAAAFRNHLIRTASHLDRFDYELRGLAGLRQQYASNPAFIDLRPQILWY